MMAPLSAYRFEMTPENGAVMREYDCSVRALLTFALETRTCSSVND